MHPMHDKDKILPQINVMDLNQKLSTRIKAKPQIVYIIKSYQHSSSHLFNSQTYHLSSKQRRFSLHP